MHGELIRRREEEALQRTSSEPRDETFAARGREIGALVQPRRAAALVGCDLGDALDACGHLEAGEPFRKDNPKRLRCRGDGGRARLVAALPDARDREAEPDQRREENPKREQPAPQDDGARRPAPLGAARLGGDYSAPLLDHER